MLSLCEDEPVNDKETSQIPTSGRLSRTTGLSDFKMILNPGADSGFGASQLEMSLQSNTSLIGWAQT